MITNFSKSPIPFLNAGMEWNASENIMKRNVSWNDNAIPGNLINYEMMMMVIIIIIITSLICLPGLVGNGIVIWLLGFRIKRNPFITYILNLAIADFGVLTAQNIWNMSIILGMFYKIHFASYLIWICDIIFTVSFLTSQWLLIVISIDRCIILYFPLWHRCHRPLHLSTAVCAVIWILTFLIPIIDITLTATRQDFILSPYSLFLNAILFMPMCVSTIAMLIKICLRSPQLKRGKLLRVILLTLLSYLLFCFPFNVICSVMFYLKQFNYSNIYLFILTSLNSSINPMLYYLVGSGKRGRSSKRIKKVLEKLFKEELDYREALETSTNTQTLSTLTI